MGTRQGNKPSSKKSHAAEDSISADSLSFAGLVSIQDQNSKPPIPNHTTHYYKVSKQGSIMKYRLSFNKTNT